MNKTLTILLSLGLGKNKIGLKNIFNLKKKSVGEINTHKMWENRGWIVREGKENKEDTPTENTTPNDKKKFFLFIL